MLAPLVGSVPAGPAYAIPPGHQVAACVAGPKGQESQWILGAVVRADADLYIVEDVMEESSKKECVRACIFVTGSARLINKRLYYFFQTLQAAQSQGCPFSFLFLWG